MRLLFVSALAFIFVCPAIPQISVADALTVTGSVRSVSADWDYDSNNETEYEFDIRLFLQFRNNTDNPLIVFMPIHFGGQTSVAFFEPSQSGSEKPLTVLPRKRDRDPVSELVSYLLASSPPPHSFTVIEPRGYYEGHTSLKVTSGYKLDLREGQKPWDGRVIAEYPAFKLRYHLSLKDRADNSDALESARRRWKKFGDLPLNSDGDYSVTSEVILNKLNN